MPVELLLPRVKVPVLPMPTYVKLAEAFGVGAGASLFDKSRYRSHGAITTATWAAGLHGYCLNFVAANPDYVLIPAAHTQLDFTSQDFSMIARFNNDDFTLLNRRILQRGAWNANGYTWILTAGGGHTFITYNLAAGQRTDSNFIMVNNTWYTVGFSRSGAVVRVYINGVDQTAVPGVHINPVTCPTGAFIGADSAVGANAFDGRIEFLRIFGGIALSASEHLAWHRALA